MRVIRYGGTATLRIGRWFWVWLRPWPHAADRCACGLTLRPPYAQRWWLTTAHDEPDRDVRAVAPYGENPDLRRAVRVYDGWQLRGALVEESAATVVRWERVGSCRYGMSHPVVLVQ